MNQKLHLLKEKIRSFRWDIVIAIILLIIGIIWMIYSVNPAIFGMVIDSVISDGTNSMVTVENFSQYLETNSIVKSLPRDASIFVSVRANDRNYNYYINGKTVNYLEEVNHKSDIKISFPEKYLSKLNENNFCDVVSEMNKKGDLSFQINTDKISLFWKYREVLKYKNCLGY